MSKNDRLHGRCICGTPIEASLLFEPTGSVTLRSAPQFTLDLIDMRVCNGLILALVVCVPGCISTWKRQSAEARLIVARNLCLRGLDAADRGRWADAEASFALAVELSPEDETAHQQYAEALWHRGLARPAIEHLQRAVTLSENNPEFLVRLGQMYLQVGELERAERRANQVLVMDARSAKAWALRADILHQQGQFNKSMASYHRALNIDRDNDEIRLALCELYIKMERHPTALMELQRIVENQQETASARALFLQGLALNAVRRPAEALEVLEQARQLGAPAAETLCQIAESHLYAGDYTSAHDFAQQAARAGASAVALDPLLDRIDVASRQRPSIRR